MSTLIMSVTGHRKQRLGIGSYFDAKAMKLRKLIKDDLLHQLSLHDTVIARNGLCAGADLLFADVCMDILEENPKVNLQIELWYPCSPYNTRLSGEDARLFKRVLDANLKKVYASKSSYFRGCEDARDAKMVDTSNYLLALVDGSGYGGAYRTIKSAQKTDTIIRKILVTEV